MPLGPDEIHVFTRRNSRSRVTAESPQFTAEFTSVTRQKTGRLRSFGESFWRISAKISANITAGTFKDSFTPHEVIWCEKRATEPKKCEKIAENCPPGAGLGQKHGNSRVIRAACATWQFTIRVTRESDLGQPGVRMRARRRRAGATDRLRSAGPGCGMI